MNNLRAICVLVWGLCVATISYAQQPTRIEGLEQKIKAATSDSAKVELLIALYDEEVNHNALHAKQRADEALRIAQKMGYQKGITESIERIADNFERQGGLSKADTHYKKALERRQRAKENLQVARLYNKIGNVAAKNKNLGEAVRCFHAAINIFEQHKNPQGVAMALVNMGDAYLDYQDWDRAMPQYKKSLALGDSLKDKSVVIRSLTGLAKTSFQQGKYKDAESYFKQLLGVGRANNRTSDLLTAYEGLSEVMAKEGNYDEAYRYYRNYVELKEFYIYKLAKYKDSEIEKAHKDVVDLETKNREIAEQKDTITYLAYLAGLGGLVALIVSIYAIRGYRRTRQAYLKLEQQTQEIESKNKELADRRAQIEHHHEAINRKNELQEAAFQEIERKNKEITASINYAKRIQESMLPTDAKIAERLPEHFIFFRPRDIVSGDFYWFTQRHGKIIIAALDCTGHGVPGAIMSMLGDSYLNQIIKLQGIIDPQEILNHLHHHIGVALNQEETLNQDGMDIAICVIDPERKVMEFAGAGRPILIIQDGKMEVLESCKLPVGGFQRDRERVFNKLSFDLQKPTAFYVFSDGFQDQFGGSKGRKFAKSRLEELLFELHPKPMKEQKKLLNKTLVEWMNENRQMDDILIIGVKLHY